MFQVGYVPRDILYQLPTIFLPVGWTIFNNLYIYNGTMFIVADSPKRFPDRMLLTSSGAPIFNEPADVARRTPSDKDMQIISRERAADLFGSGAGWLDGTSVSPCSIFLSSILEPSIPQFITTDPPQLYVIFFHNLTLLFTRCSINHYYHWCAEVFFGLWRTYSTLDPNIRDDGLTGLPAPRRLMMSHVPYDKFRDYAGMTQWVTKAVFPAISFEYELDWTDRALMNRPFLLERVVLSDRAAAMHNPMFTLTQRSNAELFKLRGSPYWWSTIRNNLVQFAGGDPLQSSRNVITYISRQDWNQRKLIPEDHDRLVAALMKLHTDYGYEINIVSMEKVSRDEQIRLAGRTTVSSLPSLSN